MHFTPTTFALLGLAAVGSGHVIMNTPKPFAESVAGNGPLEKAGTDFPCRTSGGKYTSQGMNSMALGSTQPLAFTGGAVHGGGSCQVSITYDTAPTKDSVWKVIHSIEGGCPMQGQTGNQVGETATMAAGNYSFQVPTTLPTGTATLAWTWFNKIGNREMYMNCAPITLTSGTTKRDELIQRDQAAFSALPDMFKANIDNIGSTCGTVDSTDVIFPNPGDSLELLGGSTTAALAAPTGCAAGSGATGRSSATATGGASSTPKTTAPATASASAPKSTGKASSASTLPGGVFATVPTTGKASATSAPVASASSPVSVPVASASPAASKASSATTPAATGTTGSGTAMTAGTACTTEGMWNCIDGSSFQQCASGMWSAVQQMASGTTCTAGQSTALKMAAIVSKPKRAIRFSGGHARRMAENS